MIQAIRGTHDILPGEVERWQRLEVVAREVCRRYGYQEIRTPVIEQEELFAKGTGESTDIVQKEMYTFTDKGGEKVTLRPEVTPSIVRAFVEHTLDQKLPISKLYSMGPMFRYERPQKGRYRQFHQFDVEVFGIEAPSLDSEIIEMAAKFVAELEINDSELIINSVGCKNCRPAFSQALLAALDDKLPQLCADCRRRAETNPLRIFDCKVVADQSIIDGLPHTVDHLCPSCRDHFNEVKRGLEAYALDYQISHRLVRGIDYYMRTTFEILGKHLGAQDALLGGGRYDGLVKHLGGSDYAGIGYAAGLERLIMAMPEASGLINFPIVYVIAIGEVSSSPVQVLARDLRNAGLSAFIDYKVRSLRSQMKHADKIGATHVLIVGSNELERREVLLRNMATGDQEIITRDTIVDHLCKIESTLVNK